MPPQSAQNPPSRHNTIYFTSALSGDQQVSSHEDAVNFLDDAISLGKSESPWSVVESILSSAHGRLNLRAAFRYASQPDTIISVVLPFINLLSDPEIKLVGGGIFLDKILGAIPRSLKLDILKVYEKGKVQNENLTTFLWFSLEQIYIELEGAVNNKAVVPWVLEPLLLARPHATRLANRISQVMRTRAELTSAGNGTGLHDRPDTVFVDFRDIVIYPAVYELLPTVQPLFPQVGDMLSSDIPDAARIPRYLCWLFHILRADMVNAMKVDIKAAVTCSNVISGPRPFGLLKILHGTNTPSRWRPFTLTIECGCGMEGFANMTETDRLKLLASLEAMFKEGSLGVLCLRTQTIAYGTMFKDSKALKDGRTIFDLQLKDATSMAQALTTLSGPESKKVTLHTLDTPVSESEAILQGLKKLVEIPLGDLLVNPKAKGKLKHPRRMRAMLVELERSHVEGKDTRLEGYEVLRQPQVLEASRLESFIHGLKHPLALIQAPPRTAKFYMGALLVRAILSTTTRRVLVLSPSYDVRDKVLQEPKDMDVNRSSMICLRSQSSVATKSDEDEDKRPSIKFDRIKNQASTRGTIGGEG